MVATAGDNQCEVGECHGSKIFVLCSVTVSDLISFHFHHVSPCWMRRPKARNGGKCMKVQLLYCVVLFSDLIRSIFAMSKWEQSGTTAFK